MSSGVKNQEEDRKSNDQSETHINLKVKGQDGKVLYFKIKRSTKLQKVMNAYCDRKSMKLKLFCFTFDGKNLLGKNTPDELEMEDGDEIDAMLHQLGGATA